MQLERGQDNHWCFGVCRSSSGLFASRFFGFPWVNEYCSFGIPPSRRGLLYSSILMMKQFDSLFLIVFHSFLAGSKDEDHIQVQEVRAVDRFLSSPFRQLSMRH
jgi:hypothetical protein